MSAIEQVLDEARAAGIRLWVEAGELKYRAPKGALSAAMRAALQSCKGELIARLADDGAAGISPVPAAADYALSPAQRRVWVLAQMEAGSAAYNMPFALRLTGRLDPAAFAAAVTAVVRRHESLRTIFVTVNGEPRQRVQPESGVRVVAHDFPAESDPAAAVRAWVRDEAARSFDLEHEPLLRVALLRLAADTHVLATTLHHIVADGTSLVVLVRELAAAYAAALSGTEPAWPPLPVQYRDYAAWQNTRLVGREMAAHGDYWRQQLAGVPPALELPTDRPRPAVQTFTGRIHAFRLDGDGRRGLNTLARGEQASLFMVLVALVKVLLRAHTGQEDIVVASPAAGRDHAELEGQIGFYLNTLVLRDPVPGARGFRELLRQVRKTALAAYEHQAYPFDELVGSLQLPRDLSRAPLCDAVVVLQNTGILDLTLAGLEIRSFAFEAGVSKFDLTFDFQETADGIAAGIEYNTDLFDADRIERLAAQFGELVGAVLAEPDCPVARLGLLPAGERSALEAFTATSRPIPPGTFVTLFEAQVARTPAAPALTAGGATLAYAELNTRADRLAARLAELGAGPGKLVGVCLERSAAMVTALLAVLKSGAAYVPLDPMFPRDRLAFMLEDSGAAILIAGEDERKLFDGFTGATVAPDSAAPVRGQPAVPAGPADAAYVIYTSGSTGRPKGVEITHGALVNFLLSVREAPGLTAADTVLAVTTISFDIAGLELWLPLITGGRVALADRATAADGAALREALRTSGATVMQATPATWRLLLAAGWTGSPGLRLLCGGEALPADLAARLLPCGAELWNLYGPTETTIWSTVRRVSAVDATEGTVSIGRPIANTRCVVWSQDGTPSPVGVPGELLIGGAGVARGYWRRPELTAEKFVADPSGVTPGARLYRTGDRARWRADGTLEYLGRNDHQVKLRGFRIELGEIELVLAAHPGVRAAAVVLGSDPAGDARLIAYFVARESPVSATALREFVRERIPEYMIPSAWVPLAALPLTPNGKVDRRALPAPEAPAESEFVAPEGAREEAVARIWASVLGFPRIGRDQNFFDLGGHSLKATRAVARLREQFGSGFTITDIFRRPTVAGFASLLPANVSPVADQPGVAPMTAAELEMLND